MVNSVVSVFVCQAEDGIRDLVRSRGLGDVYKRQDVGGAKNVGIHAVWIHRDRLEIKEEPIVVPDRILSLIHI